MEKNIPTKLLELPIEEFIELKKELDDNCLITFLTPIDFFKTRVIDKREKIKSLLNKQNIIFELMKVNPSFVLYYNYYFGIKLHDFSIDFILELISIYQENPEVLECLLKTLPTNLKIEVLKQYDFPSNILYKIGISLSIEVIDYLFKENVIVSFTTIDMTILDTDLLNEYCILFNVFPFNLHDLVNINLNILNKLNVSLEIKNNLISDFKEKANEILA